jgi:hypothetical protein
VQPNRSFYDDKKPLTGIIIELFLYLNFYDGTKDLTTFFVGLRKTTPTDLLTTPKYRQQISFGSCFSNWMANFGSQSSIFNINFLIFLGVGSPNHPSGLRGFRSCSHLTGRKCFWSTRDNKLIDQKGFLLVDEVILPHQLEGISSG